MAVILETSIGQLVVDLYTAERPRCEFTYDLPVSSTWLHCMIGYELEHELDASADPSHPTDDDGEQS